MAAATKFTNYPAAVEGFDHIGFGRWFMYLVGAFELAGAIGLAALGLVLLLIGSVITQLLLFAPVTALTPAGYLIPIAIIAWARQHTRRLLRLA